MSVRAAVIKKTTNAVITILLILAANFVMFRLLPADPARAFTRTTHVANPELIDRQREIFGLNDPLAVQIQKYFVNTFTGNWGYSFYQQDRPVVEIIGEKAIWTLILVGTSTVITLWLGIVIGAIAAMRRRKAFDLVSLGIGFFLYAMPTFWLAIVLIIIFQRNIGIIPILPVAHTLPTPTEPDFATDPLGMFVGALNHWILPALTLTLVQLAGIFIIMRNSLTDILTEDYIITARAKGLSERSILKGHAMPNARLPMVTTIALNLAFVLGGAIQVETVFSYEGLGSLTVESVLNADYPILQGLFLLFTISVVIANLISDFVYVWLDPRVRLE